MATTRPRGFIDWKPQSATIDLVLAVQSVLEEYEAELPLTARQIFYRLVAGGFDKTEQAYSRLTEALQKARRAGYIAWEAIRDDKFAENAPSSFDSAGQFVDAVKAQAARLRLDRQAGQEVRLVFWVEARGIQPMVANMVRDFGIPVYSSGGFDSVTAKHAMAQKLSAGPHEVLHLGDFDPSGEHVFSSLQEDVEAFASRMGCIPAFTRLAVTQEQVRHYSLETAPAKKTDRRSFSGDGTVQLEAFDPTTLRIIVLEAIEQRVDHHKLEIVIGAEATARSSLNSALGSIAV